MVQFNFTYDANVSIEQRIGFELAGAIWASFLTDDVEINLHIGTSGGLDDGKAVGGAVPIFQEQSYGVFREYFEQDATAGSSYETTVDEQAVASLQVGNTVDLLSNGNVINGNTGILLTSAQSKALGMDKAINLENGSQWNRGLVDSNALDGFIVISNDFDWSYDFARAGESAEGKLDFLSMALHEIGHNLGFVSGIDGSMDIFQMLSGETKIEGFTALDLFRHTEDTAKLENSDGSVSDVSTGGTAFLSFDGGETNTGNLSTGKDVEAGGDGYQASHWQRMQTAMGIMDPTLAYKERLNLEERDLQALDVLGWDVNYGILDTGVDIGSLLQQAEQTVSANLGLTSSYLTENRGQDHIYTLGYGQLFQIMEQQMLALGYGKLFQAFELSYGRLFQSLEDSEDGAELGYERFWQQLEEQLFELGYGRLFQEFQGEMYELGYGGLFQMFELSYGRLFQELDSHFDTLRDANNPQSSDGSVVDNSDSKESTVISGSNADDILGGSRFRDLVKGGGGDDLIDGKAGDDRLNGEEGNDVLYGGAGNDQLYGGVGNDLLIGEAGVDKLYGQAGHDILSGGYDNDFLEGGAGRDQLKGDAGDDTVDGGVGDDDVDGGEDNDIVIGGDGKDFVSGGDGDDKLYGDRYFTDGSSSSTESDPLDLQQSFEKANPASSTKGPSIDFLIELEAEDFELTHFNKGKREGESDYSFIETGGRGKATNTFSGPDGIYDIVVGYYDEADGKGELALEIGSKRNKQKFEWELNENFGGDVAGIDNFTTYTIRGVELKEKEEIELSGKAKHGEFISVDSIYIMSATEGTVFADAQFYNGSFYIDGSNKTEQEISDLGGKQLAEITKDTEKDIDGDADKEEILAERYWLENTLGKTKDIIKVDVSDSRLNLLLDKATLETNSTVRIEAEDFDNVTGGYEVKRRHDFASGKEVIASSGKGFGEATTAFTGDTGIYNIFVSYIDQGNKKTKVSFGINEQTLDTWSFDTNSRQAEYRAVKSQVSLKEGDTIKLQGWANRDEEAQIDYVDFVKVEEGSSQVSNLPTVRIEAEDVSWRDGDSKDEEEDYASGGKLVEAKDDAYATKTFEGESGLYNIVVGYDDEGKGESKFSVSVNGNSLGRWNLAPGQKDKVNSQALTTEVLLNYGDRLKFKTGEKKVKIDYIDFLKSADVPIADSQDNSQPTLAAGDVILLEAEGMVTDSKSKAVTKDAEFASGNGYAKLDGGSIATRFTGETGYYDVVVGYYDLQKGSAELEVKLGGKTLGERWRLDDPFNGDETYAKFVTRTVASGVELTSGVDVLQVLSSTDQDDKGYVDYIKLVKVDPPGEVAVNADQSNNSDTLRGGRGNDEIYGGDGNDLIYGEDGFDDGLGDASHSSDTIFGGDGDDEIYGNSGDDRLYGDNDASALLNGAAVYKDSQYVLLDDRLGWQAAQSEAVRLGGNLVTINNEQEEQWLQDQFGGSESFWIGLSDQAQEGSFKWASGEALDYTNWSGYGPDNYYNQDYASIKWTGSQGSEWADDYESGGWEYKDEWQWQSGYRGIVEVALPEGMERGNDTIEGGGGNDWVSGGIGDDRLDGSDAVLLGAFEKDILNGGAGADTFVLGSSAQSYYISDGNNDYALIEDFNVSTDLLQLHGADDDYRQQRDGNDLRLLKGGDLVAVLSNSTELNLSGTNVTFVS